MTDEKQMESEDLSPEQAGLLLKSIAELEREEAGVQVSNVKAKPE